MKFLVGASPVKPNAYAFAIWPDTSDNQTHLSVRQQLDISDLFATNPIWIESEANLGDELVIFDAPTAGVGNITIKGGQPGIRRCISMPIGVAW